MQFTANIKMGFVIWELLMLEKAPNVCSIIKTAGTYLWADVSDVGTRHELSEESVQLRALDVSVT
jgi:hypothetical protein